jgi:urate oxidase
MPTVLVHNAYGKSRIRLTKVQRFAERHDLFEWSIDVQLTGDFAAAYSTGDNRNVVATDTMKNIVYALAADHDLTSPEAFGLVLGQHFLTYPQVESARLGITVDGWRRIEVSGRPHTHAFVGEGPEKRISTVTVDRRTERVSAGLTDLVVLKTTDSSWRDFHRDAYRTLPDADDRIFATSVTAVWKYAATIDWNPAHAAVRAALLETFAGHKSLGVQHTLQAMGQAALTAVPQADEITLTMPNSHRIPINLTPLGRENTNSVFVATDEPYGLITGTVRRLG